MQHKFKLLVGTTLLSTLPIAGCVMHATQLLLPKEIDDRYTVTKVTNRSSFSGALADESFTLGRYQIQNVKRDWTTTESTGIGHFSKQTGKNSYTYNFISGSSSTPSMCQVRLKGKSVDVGSGWSIGNESIRVECGCGPDNTLSIGNTLIDREDAIQIDLGNGDRVAATKEYQDPNASSAFIQNYQGDAQIGGSTYRVISLHDTDQGITLPEPIGFRVESQEEVLGVAEIERPGRVWLKKETPDNINAGLSCLLAGIMLYQPIEELSIK